jgi:Protein of unknown function (DUF3455)
MHGKLSAVAILSVSAMLAQPAAAQTPAIDQLPAALKPGGMAVYLEVPATGVQIYTCGKNNAGAWAWNFKGPEAELFDTQKKSIGKHYGGPTWEGADGGKVVGAMKANAPAPGGSSIPWLLLDIKSSEGSGQFAQAKGILRVSTTGGTAPAQGCDEAHANQESRVPYTAVYLFLK